MRRRLFIGATLTLSFAVASLAGAAAPSFSAPAGANSRDAAKTARVQEVWDGFWQTTKIHGAVKFVQDGRDVRGRYFDSDGNKIHGARLTGEVKGRDGTKLVGDYTCDGNGSFEIELTSGETFAGQYDPDGFFNRPKNWRGTKR